MTAESAQRPRWKRRAGQVLILVGVAALLGVAVFGVLLTSWSSVSRVSAADADTAFARALAPFGEGPAYLVIDASGGVEVRRELERDDPPELEALHLLAWEPVHERLVDVAFPMWFVRVKMSGGLDLGTLTSLLAGDWQHLDVSVSLRDLERRGPGLVLDHARADGARIVLWTE
jgi:hypothetical protein